MGARTLACPVRIGGVGLHSGAPCEVELRPAAEGICFTALSDPSAQPIPAHVAQYQPVRQPVPIPAQAAQYQPVRQAIQFQTGPKDHFFCVPNPLIALQIISQIRLAFLKLKISH